MNSLLNVLIKFIKVCILKCCCVCLPKREMTEKTSESSPSDDDIDNLEKNIKRNINDYNANYDRRTHKAIKNINVTNECKIDELEASSNQNELTNKLDSFLNESKNNLSLDIKNNCLDNNSNNKNINQLTESISGSNNTDRETMDNLKEKTKVLKDKMKIRKKPKSENNPLAKLTQKLQQIKPKKSGNRMPRDNKLKDMVHSLAEKTHIKKSSKNDKINENGPSFGIRHPPGQSDRNESHLDEIRSEADTGSMVENL